MRQATSISMLVDSPHRIEPTVKRPMAQAKTRRVPKRSAIQPLTGMKTARLSVARQHRLDVERRHLHCLGDGRDSRVEDGRVERLHEEGDGDQPGQQALDGVFGGGSLRSYDPPAEFWTGGRQERRTNMREPARRAVRGQLHSVAVAQPSSGEPAPSTRRGRGGAVGRLPVTRGARRLPSPGSGRLRAPTISAMAWSQVSFRSRPQPACRPAGHRRRRPAGPRCSVR